LPVLRERPLAYTRTQIALHWLVVGLVVAQYATSGAIVRTHSIHLIGQRPSATDLVLHTLHNRVGLTIVALTIGRLALRLSVGAPVPGDESGGLAARLAQGVHFAFYAVLIMEGFTGAVASYFWWPISTAHVILFKVLLALVAIHVAAALWHEFVRKDAVISRMGFKAINGNRKAIREGGRRRT
jgi:cytochrome b561